MNLSRAKRRWKARILIHHFANGLTFGVRSGEWWVGVRRDFATDSTWINLFGLVLIIPAEFWWNRRNR